MTGTLDRPRAVARTLAGFAALTLAVSASACAGVIRTDTTGELPAGAVQLVAFDSCDATLAELTEAASAVAQPYGLPGDGIALLEGADTGARALTAPGLAEAGDAAGAASAGTGYSGTNTHEAGVDEPDLVKTDGHRIVTVSAGMLRVIDASTRQVTGKLNLTRVLSSDGDTGVTGHPGGVLRPDFVPFVAADLLLFGDHALVLASGQYPGFAADAPPARPAGQPDAMEQAGAAGLPGARLLLVDLTGNPEVLSRYTADGTLVDARQVGGVVRAVLRSRPRLSFPYLEKGTDVDRIAANRKIIHQSTLDDWLPRYEITTGDRRTSGRVECTAVRRPAAYTGATMLTLVTLDLTADHFASGDPITVVADGDTVYSNGTSLYVSADQRWRAGPGQRGDDATAGQTQIFKFDISGTGAPRYLAGGAVPGYLINQYAMSEWDGHLRVATTTGQPWDPDPATSSQSGVYLLAQRADTLALTGHVGGLGRGERIYAVRFTGPVGYVVTFRQTDPLYVVDLADPTKPTVRGALKISGYSAYLHPVGDGRLIGIGQEADARGRTQGTQVSLFDVADPGSPALLARYHLNGGHSQAEFDPHAFLYWPADGTLVVPLQVHPEAIAEPALPPDGDTGDSVVSNGAADPAGLRRAQPTSSVLVLRISGETVTRVGSVRQPLPSTSFVPINRSLRIGGTLWTISDRGVMATDATTLARLAWLPY